MRRVLFFAVALSLACVSGPTYSQQSDALSPLQGLWAAKWTVQGNSKVQQVLFALDPADSGKRLVSLPFLPGVVRISHCEGLGCSGADLVVSGVDSNQRSFDCLYAFTPHDNSNFSWTFKGGVNTVGCPPDAEFRKDPGTDALNQMQGLWQAKWTTNGNLKIQQVLFALDPGDSRKRLVSLPFLPGVVRISHCVGLGCSGADVVVSGTDLSETGFDCLYAHSIFNKDSFGWTFKGGDNTDGCPHDAEFDKAGN